MTTIIDEIYDLLKNNLPIDNIQEVKIELSNISVLRPKLLKELVLAHNEVFLATAKFRRPVEKGLTDFDRRILLNELLTDTQSKYETLLGLSELLSDRRQDLLVLINHFE